MNLMNLMKESRFEAQRAYMPKNSNIYIYIHIYKFINYYNEISKYMVVSSHRPVPKLA